MNPELSLQIKLYKTSSDSIESTSIAICDKIYTSGDNFFVFIQSKDYANEFDRLMWTYSSPKFIPHLQSESNEALMYSSYDLAKINHIGASLELSLKASSVIMPVPLKYSLEELALSILNLQNFIDSIYLKGNDLKTLHSICVIFCDDDKVLDRFNIFAKFIEFLKTSCIKYNLWDNTNALKTWEKII
jgi:hypothetical protein